MLNQQDREYLILKFLQRNRDAVWYKKCRITQVSFLGFFTNLGYDVDEISEDLTRLDNEHFLEVSKNKYMKITNEGEEHLSTITQPNKKIHLLLDNFWNIKGFEWLKFRMVMVIGVISAFFFMLGWGIISYFCYNNNDIISIFIVVPFTIVIFFLLLRSDIKNYRKTRNLFSKLNISINKSLNRT